MHNSRCADTNACEPEPGGLVPQQAHEGGQPSGCVGGLVGELWAYSTQGSWKLHEDALALVTQLSAASISWLTLSDYSLVCKWKLEERLTVVPSAAQNARLGLFIF